MNPISGSGSATNATLKHETDSKIDAAQLPRLHRILDILGGNGADAFDDALMEVSCIPSSSSLYSTVYSFFEKTPDGPERAAKIRMQIITLMGPLARPSALPPAAAPVPSTPAPIPMPQPVPKGSVDATAHVTAAVAAGLIAPAPTPAPAPTVTPKLSAAAAAAAAAAPPAPMPPPQSTAISIPPPQRPLSIQELLHQGKFSEVIAWANSTFSKPVAERIVAIVQCPRSFIEKAMMIHIEKLKSEDKAEEADQLRKMLVKISRIAGFFERCRSSLGSEVEVKLSDVMDHKGTIIPSKFVDVKRFGQCDFIVFNTSGGKLSVVKSTREDAAAYPTTATITGEMDSKEKEGKEKESKIAYSISVDNSPNSEMLYFGRPVRSQYTVASIYGRACVDIMWLDERPKGARGKVDEDTTGHRWRYEKQMRTPPKSGNNQFTMEFDPSEVDETHPVRGISAQEYAKLRQATHYYQLGNDNILAMNLAAIRGKVDRIFPPYIVRYLETTASESLCLNFDRKINKWRIIHLVDPVALNQRVRVLTSRPNDAWKKWRIADYFKENPGKTSGDWEKFFRSGPREPAVERYVDGHNVSGMFEGSGTINFISTIDYHFEFSEAEAKIVRGATSQEAEAKMGHGATREVFATLPCTISATKSDTQNPRMRTVDEIFQRIIAGDIRVEEPVVGSTETLYQVTPEMYLSVAQGQGGEGSAEVGVITPSKFDVFGRNIPCDFNRDTLSIDKVRDMTKSVLRYSGVTLRGNYPHLHHRRVGGSTVFLQKATEFPLYPLIQSTRVFRGLAASDISRMLPKELLDTIREFASDDAGAREAEDVFESFDSLTKST